VVEKYTLFVNTKDCFGCSTCEVACKQEHSLPSGLRFIRVYSDRPRMIEGKSQLRYIVTYCTHCSQPPCKDVCTTNAIHKREDGIVLIDEKLCTGCKDCIEACPLGVISFDEEQGLAKKCDLCVDLIDQGLSPACVSACPAYCIFLGKE
jgi:Fe-S-cluster-containing dehydrogenase component